MKNHESSGDLKDLSTGLKCIDKSENAMLRSRIEEQGQLICFLKQRADQQLKRLQTLEEVNNELHLLRTQALEESKERFRTCEMLERRFHELSENHVEMIKIKDEYKCQCQRLTVENNSLKDKLRRNFSDDIHERDSIIEDLKRKLATWKEKVTSQEMKTERVQDDLDNLKSSSGKKIKTMEEELQLYKRKNNSLTAEITQLKHRQAQKSGKENELISTLKKENQRMVDQIMERGKLLQERQSEVDKLKNEVEKKDLEINSLVNDFNKKKDLVNSNLRVKCLENERDKLAEELADMNRKFEAYRLHSHNLLEKEKDLNSKLRNNVILR